MRTINITYSSRTMAVSISAILLLITLTTTTTTHAFGIVRPTREGTRIAGVKTQLQAFSFQTASSFVISDEIGVGELLSDGTGATATTTATETAIAAASDASEVFTDQIDLFGDPTVRTLFLVFGGVVVVLAGLSVLSKKVDDAILSVVGDFEVVLRTSPEFKSKWAEIEPQLKQYDQEVDKAIKRKQKLFEIMEEMQAKEPALMERINTKMAQIDAQ